MFLKFFYPFLFVFASHAKKVSSNQDPKNVAERLSKQTMLAMTEDPQGKDTRSSVSQPFFICGTLPWLYNNLAAPLATI